MGKKIPLRISLVIFLVVILIIPLGSSALPPEARKEKCEKTGGDWNDDSWDCICPEGATSLWDYCWIITPKEVCGILGGNIEHEQIAGPAGSSFKCIEDSEDITSLTWNKARKYNVNISDPEALKEQIEGEIGGSTDEGSFPYIALLVGLGLLSVSLVFYFMVKKEES